MAELAGKSAVVKISGYAADFTDEPTTANPSRTEYQVTNSLKHVWDRTAAITVKRSTDGTNWNTVNSNEYTLKRLCGKVIFLSAQAINTQIKVSGKYLTMSTAAYAHEFSYSRACEPLAVTTFGDTHINRIPGLKSASGSLKQFDVTDTYFIDALLIGNPVVIEFRAQASGNPLRLWAYLDSSELSAAINNPQEESVSFSSTDELLKLT